MMVMMMVMVMIVYVYVICMYACVHVCMYVCTYVYMYVCSMNIDSSRDSIDDLRVQAEFRACLNNLFKAFAAPNLIPKLQTLDPKPQNLEFDLLGEPKP